MYVQKKDIVLLCEYSGRKFFLSQGTSFCASFPAQWKDRYCMSSKTKNFNQLSRLRSVNMRIESLNLGSSKAAQQLFLSLALSYQTQIPSLEKKLSASSSAFHPVSHFCFLVFFFLSFEGKLFTSVYNHSFVLLWYSCQATDQQDSRKIPKGHPEHSSK